MCVPGGSHWIDDVNAVFTPTPEEIDSCRRVVQSFDDAQARLQILARQEEMEVGPLLERDAIQPIRAVLVPFLVIDEGRIVGPVIDERPAIEAAEVDRRPAG